VILIARINPLKFIQLMAQTLNGMQLLELFIMQDVWMVAKMDHMLNNKPKMMNRVILCFILIGMASIEFANAQGDDNNFDKNFNSVAGVFEKNVKPYLQKFANSQIYSTAGKRTKEEEHLIESYYLIYQQKVEQVRKDHYEELRLKPDKEQLTMAYLTEYFTFVYRVQFPGLDYSFFDLCQKDLK